MEYDHILIRYGELGLKGKNMNQFILQLQKNVQFVLKDFENVRVSRTQGRMFVALYGEDPDAVMEKCQKVFGISSLSLAIKVENNVEAIKEGALAALVADPQAKTFKRSEERRVGKEKRIEWGRAECEGVLREIA